SADQPPEKCPVCGADRSKFVEISEKDAEAVQAQKTDKQLEREKAKVKEVYGVTEGDAAPKAAQSAGANAPQSGKSGFIEFLQRQMVKHHAHPLSVHVPNGVLPITVLFMFVAAVFSAGFLAQAAFYYTIVVLLTLPFVLYSGYNAWQRKYGGALSNLFLVKIGAAAVVTATCFLVVIWYLVNPDVIMAGAARRAGFLVVNLIMLAAAGVAGFIGGKLVFKD
ncbi:MAG: rubredoxin-like domain-containing protein, partial [Thermodesulfobacteriota bacterium]